MNKELIDAARDGDKELVKKLLDKGADKDYHDKVSQYLYSFLVY